MVIWFSYLWAMVKQKNITMEGHWQNKVAYLVVARKQWSKNRQEGLGASSLEACPGTYFLQLGPAFYTSQ